MTTKILRKVFKIVYWAVLGLLILRLILGNSTIGTNIILGIYCINIASDIKNKIYYNKIFNSYKDRFLYLQAIHKKRYYLYFSGTELEVEKYSQLVEEYSNKMLMSGKYMLRDRNASKKQREEVQEIIEKTERLKANIQPPV